MNKNYKLGMRAYKTTIAVFLCLLAGALLNRGSTLSLASVSAIVCLKTTKRETLRTDFTRLLSTILGGLFGFASGLLGVLFGSIYQEWLYLLILPAFVLLDIYLCNILGLRDVVSLSCIVTVLIGLRFELEISALALEAVSRVLDTIIGIIAATIVNFVLPTPAEDPCASQTEEQKDKQILAEEQNKKEP